MIATRSLLPILYVIGILATIATGLVLLLRSPPEPSYQGAPLSYWLKDPITERNLHFTGNSPYDRDTMARLAKRTAVIGSVGPEALPWLIAAAERDARSESLLNRKYSQLYKSSPVVRWCLPQPRSRLPALSYYDILRLLSRLAPGTSYEERALNVILLFHKQPTRPRYFEVRCDMLGCFTNHPSKVLPWLLIGLTNANTGYPAVLAFQRFGTSATPVLYPVALSETGFIKPAELALKKADPVAYERLLTEKRK